MAQFGVSLLVAVAITIVVTVPALLLAGYLIWRLQQRSNAPGVPIPATAIIVQRWTIQAGDANGRIGLLLEVRLNDHHTYFTETTVNLARGEAWLWQPGTSVDVTVSAGNLAEIGVTGLAAVQPADLDSVLRAVARRAETKNEQTRTRGKPATGIVVGSRNTGIQIPDNGFLQRLTLDVLPASGSVFRAETVLVTPGRLEPRFRPGARLLVRFDQVGLRHVTIDVSSASTE